MSRKKSKKNQIAVPKHPATNTLPAGRLRRLDEIVTLAQLVAMSVAFVGSDRVRDVVAVGCVVVFLAGGALFTWAFLIAADRSRMEDVSVVGAFFLGDGAVDTPDRRWAYGLLAAQSVIGLAAASADPYTAMAFGILVPMFGIGTMAFLGSAHGAFRVRKSNK